MAREVNVYHERVLANYTISEPDSLWRWCKFVNCTIDTRTPNQRFHECEFDSCDYVPAQKK